MARVKGTVKFYSTEKGYGFIIPDDGSDEIFVHFSNLEMDGYKSLGDGEEVEFESSFDDKHGKLTALSVTGPGGAPLQGDGSGGWGKGDWGKGDWGKGGWGKGDWGKGDWGKGGWGGGFSKGKGKGGGGWGPY